MNEVKRSENLSNVFDHSGPGKLSHCLDTIITNFDVIFLNDTPQIFHFAPAELGFARVKCFNPTANNALNVSSIR